MPEETIQKLSGKERPLISRLLFSHFVLCSVLGLIVIALFAPKLKEAREIGGAILYRRAILVAVLSGTVMGALTWLLHRIRHVRSGKTDEDAVHSRYRMYAAMVAFFCCLLDMAAFLINFGLIVLTVITLVLLVLHVRTFIKKAVLILRPGSFPTWENVGTMLYMYATMVAAFTLINMALDQSHRQIYGPESSFIFRGEQVNIIDAFYFSIVVLTTVGFGDITPLTPGAKVVVSLQCLTSYVMFALMIGVITRGIVWEGEEKETDEEDGGDIDDST